MPRFLRCCRSLVSSTSRVELTRAVSAAGRSGPMGRRAKSAWPRLWAGHSPSSHEGADARDVAADDQRLDRLSALVGVEYLDVRHVPDHVVLEQDAVPA